MQHFSHIFFIVLKEKLLSSYLLYPHMVAYNHCKVLKCLKVFKIVQKQKDTEKQIQPL